MNDATSSDDISNCNDSCCDSGTSFIHRLEEEEKSHCANDLKLNERQIQHFHYNTSTDINCMQY